MYIDQNLKKALSDRIYEKRKPAALQLEQVVRQAIEQNDVELVSGVITELGREFAYALRHPNYRNGGLIGLAAVAIALGCDNLQPYLDDIIQPILACFGDADSRVRYYACEALYNVAKIAKGEILAYFNEIFDALCKLTADLEESVRNGANLVDQLMRDIVVETASNYVFQINRDPPVIAPTTVEPEGPEGPSLQMSTDETAVAHEASVKGENYEQELSRPTSVAEKPSFTLDRFIPLLVERIYVINPATRMFLVQWIMLLDSIPDLELIKYLPGFLEGLVLFLTDSHKEVRVYTKTCLDTLLKDTASVAQLNPHNDKPGESDVLPEQKSGIEAGRYQIGQDTHIYYAEIVDILLSKMDPSHNEIRLVVLTWMGRILTVSPKDVFAKLSTLVGILLPALSDDSSEIRQFGQILNDELLDLLPEHAIEIDTHATIQALSQQLETEDKVLRLSILQWFRILYSNTPKSTSSYEELLVKLLGPLADPSDEVVSRDLELLALILRDSPDSELQSFTRKLVIAFQENEQLFRNRSRFVVLQLCVLLTPERVLPTIGQIVMRRHQKPTTEAEKSKVDQSDDFDRRVVQVMCNILLTAPEMGGLRAKLTQLHTQEDSSLFTSLFLGWCKNSVAVLSLCLLAKAYEMSFWVLEILANRDVTVHNLVQIDKLVQYIEGPVLAPLRMDLLEPSRNHFLYKTLYGLLMVLPQSSAFTVLQKRLDSVCSIFKLPDPLYVQMKAPAVESRSKESLPTKVKWVFLQDEFQKYHQYI